MKNVKKLASAVGRFFYPPRCVLCEKLLDGQENAVCPECLTVAQVFYHEPWHIPFVKSWIALWQYSGHVRDALVRYKFWHRRNYAPVFAHHLAQKLCQGKASYDVITWVPISFLRKVERGYDQVELIANALGREVGQAPVRLLRKRKHNKRQSGIRGLENRKRNVQGAYRAVNLQQIKGKKILLLEDIVTTGATVSECARMLKEAGAKEVHVACIAVANRYHR